MLRRSSVYLFVMMLIVVSVAQPALAQDRSSWTVMVYMEADNNLEGDALADILEMELVGSTPDVNIVVQIDRAEGYAVGDGDWTGARRYLVTKNNEIASVEDIVFQKVTNPDYLNLASQVVEEMGEINNGDPQTLVDFAVWAAQTYPAENYALILWDHGGTWVGGFGGDESTANHDGLNIPELDAALSLITEEMGQKFEFIGFDTCLMGQMEVFSILAHYANYAAAAEELEPGFGWFYTPLIQLLTESPEVSGHQIGSTVVNGYMDFYDVVMSSLIGEPFPSNYDQTSVDLSKIEGVQQALADFSTVATVNSAEILTAVGNARNNVQIFGGSTPDETDPLSSVDLIHFMELLIMLSDNAEVNQVAQGVIDAVNDMVILSRANAGLPDANGLSIFFPKNARAYSLGNNNQRYLNEIGYMADWQTFLDTFYDTAITEASPITVSILDVFTPTTVTNVLNPPSILFETNGTNITNIRFSAILQYSESVQFMVDQDTLESVVYTEDGEAITQYDDGVSQSQFTWGVEMPVISDAQTSVDTLLLDNGVEGQSAVSGLYGFQTGQTIDAYLTFDLETREVISVWGINPSENGGQPFEVTPTPGDEFLPTWRYLDENGELQLTTANESLVFGAEPFTLSFVPAVSGTYDFVLIVEDMAGNIALDTATIAVDNEVLMPHSGAPTT
jgi:hypothetical protein